MSELCKLALRVHKTISREKVPGESDSESSFTTRLVIKGLTSEFKKHSFATTPFQRRNLLESSGQVDPEQQSL